MTRYKQQLGRVTAHQLRRMKCAEEARRRASNGSLLTIDSLIDAAVRGISEERQDYLDDFGSALPDTLEYAVTTELEAWHRLNASLCHFRRADPGPADLATYAAQVRTYLTCQLELIGVATELLRSCLVEQYLQHIDTIKERLDQVTL